MENKRMNKNIVIVNRNNKALIYNAVSGKFQVVEDNNTSMASIKAVISLLEKLDENATELTTIIVPRSLSIMLQMNRPQSIKDNGYKSEDESRSYTKEYIDSLIYINQLRKYLGSKIVQFRIQVTGANSILTKEQNQAVRNAWALMDSLEKPQSVPNKLQRPQRPQGIMQSIEVNCI